MAPRAKKARHNPSPLPPEEEENMGDIGSPPQPVEEENIDSGSSNQSQTDPLFEEDIEPMQPLKFFFKHTEYAMYPKLQTRCEPFKTMAIIDKLKGPEVRWFREHPQFRHIVHMHMEKNRKVMGMWMLLVRTVSTDKGREAWFAVNGVPIRYSMREHGLISGLYCHQYPKDYEELGSFRFVDKHFGQHEMIKVKDVLEKLVSMKDATNDRLKMAVLFFLATVIRGKSKKVKGSINPFILKVVDDLDLCESFPWGRFTFDDSIREIMHLMNHFRGTVQSTWTFPGFILPLEILAFECIPALKTAYRQEVHAESDCPRMCKGKFKDTKTTGYTLGELYDTVGTSKDICSILQPKDGEGILMARIMEDEEIEAEVDAIDPIVDGWNKVLSRENGKIWWEDLYKFDIEGRTAVPEPETENIAEAETENGSVKEQLELVMKTIQEGFAEMNEKIGGMNTRLLAVEAYVHEKLNEGIGGMDFQYNYDWGGRNYDRTGFASGDGGAVETTYAEKAATEKAAAEKVAAEKAAAEKGVTDKATADEAIKPKGRGYKMCCRKSAESKNWKKTQQEKKKAQKEKKEAEKKSRTPRPTRTANPSHLMLTPYVPK